MLFEKLPAQNILECQTCHGGGYVGVRACGACRGMAMGRMKDGTFLYYGEPITRYHIRLATLRQYLSNFEILGASIFMLGFLALFGYEVWQTGSIDELWTLLFWSDNAAITRYAWFALLAFGFLVYRMIESVPKLLAIPLHSRDVQTSPEIPIELTWKQIRKLPRKKRENIAREFTRDARRMIERAYRLSEKTKSDLLLPAHLFAALLEQSEIRGVFIRLGVSPKQLQSRLVSLLAPPAIARKSLLSPEFMQVLFYAYDIAADAREEHVSPTDLLVAAVRSSEKLQEILYDAAIDARKLTNVIGWLRIRAKLRAMAGAVARVGSHRSKYGIDRAMTAIATPFLNAYSQDLTLAVKFGHTPPCVARDKEIEEIFRVIEGGRMNVLLVGSQGVGKMSMIEGVAERMVAEDVPARMKDKRLVQLSTSALLAGTTVSGAQERLLHMVGEIARAGNIILFINNIHDLVGLGGDGSEGLDVSGTLAEVARDGRLLIFATTTPEGFNRHITNHELGSIFTRVDVHEMTEDQAVQVLESRAGYIEYKQHIFFSYDALASAVSHAKRFLHDTPLPESAMEIATEAAGIARARGGENALVTADDVAAVVSEKTGVPRETISVDESAKLLGLEEAMHERMVGQNEAVSLVANALRRGRTDIRSTNRPIANFLFLGPTGVGKTELAKTIAAVYFGGEDRMIRLDMSEYQDKSAVYRLIGAPGTQGTGILTEAVRQRPFSLLLLDEMEKADPDILNLFLQVFDDGRLTDSVGRVIDFTNTIIIATSNAGTGYIQEQLQQGAGIEAIQKGLLRGELATYYRPEFLNRFDGIVVFRPLTRQEIKQIAGLMLNRVTKDLETRGIGLRVEDAALESLADIGFDPTFGARPMRRAIQDKVENALAELFLAKRLDRRDTVVLGNGVTVRVEKAS